MHSRRDQLEAHKFLVNRVRAALVHGEPEAARAPMRRTPVGLVIGVILGVLVSVVVGVVGALTKDDAPDFSWAKPGRLIVEKETGSRFVLQQGRLHPVRNYSSAILLFGQRPKVATTTHDMLASRPRGAAIGILGAPDQVPTSTGSGFGTWFLCAMPGTRAATPLTSVLLSPQLRPAVPAADQFLVVAAPNGQRYLLGRSGLHAVDSSWVLSALGLEAASVMPVSQSWLDVAPRAGTAGSLTVVGRGGAGPALAGRPTRVGQLLVNRTTGMAERSYLVLRGGLAPMSSLARALTLGDPATVRAYGDGRVVPLSITEAELAAANIVAPPARADVLPAIPRALSTGPGWCVRSTTDGRTVASHIVVLPAAVARGDASDQERVVTGTADRSDTGMFGGVFAAVGAGYNAQQYLVSGGVKYPVSPDAVQAFGISSGAAPAPPRMLAALPTGVSLRSLRTGGA